MLKGDKFNIKFFLCFVILIFFSVFLFYRVYEKPVYMEYTNISGLSTNYVVIDDNNSYLEQTFKMPYEVFYGVSFLTDNKKSQFNSIYEIKIIDVDDQKKILEKKFSTLDVKDDSYIDITLDNPIKVDISHTYQIKIELISYEPQNHLVLYISENDNENNSLFYDNQYKNAILTMNVFGGFTNSFWFIFSVFCIFIFIVLGLYIYYLYKNNKSIKSNKIVLAFILGIIIFLMLFVFKNIFNFWDETDYIMSGWLIDKGSVLYVDYFTQHMPFASYLCAFISFIFQAESAEQFRTIYYLLVALLYALLYIRHSNNIGKFKMFCFPLIQIIFSLLLYVDYVRILGDNIQSICMIALLLEFIQYLKDEKIDFKRSIIISSCIFCSFTSIFICIYQIFIIFIGFLIKEIMIWKKNSNFNLKNILNRYWILLLMIIIPFMILVLYLFFTDSLYGMYEQAYLFNRQVYSNYMVYFDFENFGSNIFQPFYTGIINFIKLIPESINSIVASEDIFKSVVKLLLMIYFIIINIIHLKNKRYLLASILIMLTCISFSRDNHSFHTLSAWGIIFTIIVIYFDQIKIMKKMNYFIAGLIVLLVFGNYLEMYYNYLKQPIRLINHVEFTIINKTDENDYIFHDIYSSDSLFYIYKNRIPINRMTFILPWYMEWYEDDAINDLLEYNPKVVLYDEYNEENGVWGHYYYAPRFKYYLEQNYKKIDEKSVVWVRINN